ncbi:MAG: hypothetical protein H7Y18_20570 [Clostridiaceae bacterium]|nr:hypothetical protein [Clostridiaceae bacterium]
MIKRYITKNAIIIFTVLLIWGGGYVYSQLTSEIPFSPPKTVVKYNGKAIPTSLGDHNWIPKSGGSSYETEGEFIVGQKTSKFIAKSGDAIHILIPSKPKDMKIVQIVNTDKYKEYKTFTGGGKDYVFTLPIEKGEYIFNVFASWDADRHNTSTIFRVQIE